MKTIGFLDRVTGNKTILAYYKEGQTRHERITAAFKELKHTGNINVYYIKGNKIRFLFKKGM